MMLHDRLAKERMRALAPANPGKCGENAGKVLAIRQKSYAAYATELALHRMRRSRSARRGAEIISRLNLSENLHGQLRQRLPPSWQRSR